MLLSSCSWLHRFKPWNEILFDEGIHQLFDFGQLPAFARNNECDGNAILAHTARAADAVDVAFRVFGQIIIDDV